MLLVRGGGTPRRLIDTVLRHFSAELYGLDCTQWMAQTFSSLLLTVTMCFLTVYYLTNIKLLPNTTYHTYSLRNRRHNYTLSNKTDTDERNYPPFASIAKGEVFGLLYVCLFVCSSTISRQPAGRFTPKFAYGRTLVPDVSSPLLGLAASGGRKRGQMNFSLLWESIGNFCILAVFERYLSNACTDPHQILFV